MKHLNLFPVDTRNAILPGHHDQLQAWIDRLPGWFAEPRVPWPKATLLCGLPGVGKATATKVIAKTLNRPLFLLDGSIPLTELSRLVDKEDPFVLWMDRPGEQHLAILRWLQSPDDFKVFVVFTTDAPHKLPPGFTRADVVSSAWHLDLPDLRQRSALWGDFLADSIPGHHEHDSVRLSQVSPMFAPVEIRAAYDNATRECGGVPKPGALIDAVLATKALALRMDEHLACLRAWAHEHACSAASKSVMSEV